MAKGSQGTTNVTTGIEFRPGLWIAIVSDLDDPVFDHIHGWIESGDSVMQCVAELADAYRLALLDPRSPRLAELSAKYGFTADQLRDLPGPVTATSRSHPLMPD